MAKFESAPAYLYITGMGLEQHLIEIKRAVAKIPNEFILSDYRCFPLISNYFTEEGMKKINLAYAFDKELFPHDTSRISGIMINPALPGMRRITEASIFHTPDEYWKNAYFVINDVKFVIVPHAYDLHKLSYDYITPKENYAKINRKALEN